MKVLVTGGRDYADETRVGAELARLYSNDKFLEVAHGDARGADTLAANWCRRYSIPCTAFPANWKAYGKAAGVIRNQEMLDEFKPDIVLAFPGGRGTRNMVSIARRAEIDIIEVK